MSDERNNEVIMQEAAAPRWMGIAVVALAVVSLIGLGVGWSASNRSKALEQTLAGQSQQINQFKQGDDVLGQRLAKAEDANAQLEGELSVVTDKMKLTQTELGRARAQAKKIREDENKEIAELQTNVTGQLATKASVDDVNKIGTDVNGVRTDLDTTKNNLQM